MKRLEHPRADYYRKNWKSLNGIWQFEIGDNNPKNQMAYLTHDLEGEIEVPFAVGSAASGVQCDKSPRSVWYKRTFDITVSELTGSILLNFCAVDYRAEVYINGTMVYVNKGGYTPFTIEISKFCTVGANVLVVNALDDDSDLAIPSGYQKECAKPLVGIWQTVYLEFSGSNYIVDSRPTCLTDKKCIVLEGNLARDTGGYLVAKISYDGKEIASYRYKAQKHYILTAPIKEPLQMWNVLNAKLYNIELQIVDESKMIVDSINTYCGFRNIRLADNKLTINDKEVKIRAVYDAGYFPQGGHTAPSAAAIKQDLLNIVSLGYNAVAPYNKLMEPLYLYYADILGVMVIESYPTGGADCNSSSAKRAIHQEWLKALSRDYMHPSIIVWSPILLSYTAKVDIKHNLYCETKARDSERLVIDALVGTHYKTDVFSFELDSENEGVFLSQLFMPTNGKYASEKAERLAYKKDDKLMTQQALSGAPKFVAKYGVSNSGGDTQAFLKKYETFTSAIVASGAIGYIYMMLTDICDNQCGIYDVNRNIKLSREAQYEFIRINGKE